MSNIEETNLWEELIYQIKTTDPAIGGAPNLETGTGLMNVQAQQLANRTLYLKLLIEALQDSLGGLDYVTPAQLTTAVNNAINDIRDGVPGALDTLKEISDALADDDNAIAALTAALAGKVDLATVQAGFVPNPVFLTSADDVNNLDDGWYAWGSSVPANAPTTFCNLQQTSSPSSAAIQKLIGTTTGVMGVRRKTSGSWPVFTFALTENSNLNASKLTSGTVHFERLPRANYAGAVAGTSFEHVMTALNVKDAIETRAMTLNTAQVVASSKTFTGSIAFNGLVNVNNHMTFGGAAKIVRGLGAASSTPASWEDANNMRSNSGLTLMRGFDSTDGPSDTGTDTNAYYHPWSHEYSNSGNMTQFAIPYITSGNPDTQVGYNDIFYHSKFNGVVAPWIRLLSDNNIHQFADNSIKKRVNLNASQTIMDHKGISSVSVLSSGLIKINFDGDMPDLNYGVTPSFSASGSAGGDTRTYVEYVDKQVDSVTIKITNIHGTGFNPNDLTVLITG